MRKALILLLITSLVFGGSIEVMAAATAYHQGSIGGGSGNLAIGAMERRTSKLFITSKGYIVFIAKRRTTEVYDLFYSSNGGANWGTITNIFAYANSAGGNTEALYGFKDSIWVVSAEDGGATVDTSIRIALIRDTTLAVLDTILTTDQKTTGTHQVYPLGADRIVIVHMVEGGATDTTVVQISDGPFSQTVGYTRLETSTTTPPYGKRVNLIWNSGRRGCAVAYDQAAQDVHVYDSATGINAAVDLNFLPVVESYDGFDYVAMRDSMLMWVYHESFTAGADSIRWKRAYITGVEAGTPDITPIDSGTIVSAANMYDGMRFNPCLSHLDGTDSVFLWGKDWTGGLGQYDYNIARWVWNGSSWSGPTTWYTVPGSTDTLAMLHASNKIWNISGTIRQAVSYCDSLAIDSAHVLIEDLFVGTGGATSVRNTFKKTSLKKATLFHQNPDIWRPENEVY